MNDDCFRFRFVIVGCLILLAVTLWWSLVVGVSIAGDGLLTVRFLDVGQGDAIHITSPEGYEMLIDGGASGVVLRELMRGRSFFDRQIEVVVATHPDTDHVAGLVDVFRRFEVSAVLESGVTGDSVSARAYHQVADKEGVSRIVAQAGQIIRFGSNTSIRVLSPLGDTTNWENNTASVVVQVVHGDIEFMLTGDAPSGVEEYLSHTYGSVLESEVLKLGHHGSKTSSSELFLNMVRPKYAVVSAGIDNRYGHPDPTVVETVRAGGAQVVSTAERGTITFKSDGQRVWVE